MRPVLVLPTYNERGNIEEVLRAALTTAPDLRILVVDDASPDGTGAVAASFARSDRRVRLLSRSRKLGLGSAYREGFARAIADLNADVVLEMDADRSHDPADLPRLLAAVATADLVIGSRYVPQGGADGWSLPRRAFSRTANLLTRLAVNSGVRDCTSGFRCYRASALQAAGLQESRCRGYAFQIEMTARILESGSRIREVPIVFHERRRGRTKMSTAIIAEALLLLARLVARRILGSLRLRAAGSESGPEARRASDP